MTPDQRERMMKKPTAPAVPVKPVSAPPPAVRVPDRVDRKPAPVVQKPVVAPSIVKPPTAPNVPVRPPVDRLPSPPKLTTYASPGQPSKVVTGAVPAKVQTAPSQTITAAPGTTVNAGGNKKPPADPNAAKKAQRAANAANAGKQYGTFKEALAALHPAEVSKYIADGSGLNAAEMQKLAAKYPLLFQQYKNRPGGLGGALPAGFRAQFSGAGTGTGTGDGTTGGGITGGGDDVGGDEDGGDFAPGMERDAASFLDNSDAAVTARALQALALRGGGGGVGGGGGAGSTDSLTAGSTRKVMQDPGEQAAFQEIQPYQSMFNLAAPDYPFIAPYLRGYRSQWL